MLTKKVRAEQYRAQQVVVEEAATRLRGIHKPDVKKYAAQTGLPYQRLLRAYKGGKSRTTRRSGTFKLTDEQDLALQRYLDAVDAIGFGIQHQTIVVKANTMLEEAHLGDAEPPKVGRNWATEWLKRHPKYKEVKAKPMEVMRLMAEQPEGLQGWFDRLKLMLDKHGVVADEGFTMDETGCRIGVARNGCVQLSWSPNSSSKC